MIRAVRERLEAAPNILNVQSRNRTDDDSLALGTCYLLAVAPSTKFTRSEPLCVSTRTVANIVHTAKMFYDANFLATGQKTSLKSSDCDSSRERKQ